MLPSATKLGIDATMKLPSNVFKRHWPPLTKMDEGVRAKMEKLQGAKKS